MSKGPAAVVFDWDSTLADNWGSFTLVMNKTYAAFGMPGRTEADYRSVAARSARDVFPEIFGDQADRAHEIFYREFTAHHLTKLKPMGGAEALLAHLHRSDILLSIVSNKSGAFLRREVDHLAWTPKFHRVIGANDAGSDKPSAAPMSLALEGGGIAATKGAVWYVGDTALDMEFAHNAGCRAVLVNAESRDLNDFAAYPPDLVVDRCDSLIEHLWA